ncbi:MAG TPA: hypothetical protein VJ204_10780 [Solirubrobacterales bacterium]|nr:hypothetical protein [Solirubrobacterales bacterium]
MNRRLFRNFSRAVLLAIVALLLAAGAASAAGPAEGGFENGLAAWTKTSFYGNTEWTAQTKADAEAEFETTLPTAIGPYVAATEYDGNDTAILAQTFALPAASNLNLSLYLFYESATPTVVPTPNTLFVKPSEGEPGGNQQVRVDVLKANAPLESLSPNDILATLYASPAGGPEVLEPTLLSADLSQFAGQTVTLRIANATSDGEMRVGVGDVSLTATPLPPAPPAPAAAEETPTTPVSDGVASPVAHKLVRSLSTGGALLAVRLPEAGSLVVSDARRKAAIASAFSAPRTVSAMPSFTARRSTGTSKPVLIRTASVAVDRPQTVHVRLRPTTAASRLLAKKGRVPFRLQLTFTSARGAVSTATYKGVLVKRLRPAPR